MAKGKRKKRKQPRQPPREETPRTVSAAAKPSPEPPTAPDAAAGTGSTGRLLVIVERTAALALMAALGVSLTAYFIPRKRQPDEQASAWDRMQAPRVWQTVRLWGMSRDEKRLRAPVEWMGGRVFAFTQFWGKYLDKRLMPMTKFHRWTRDEHVAYLLPGTGRPRPPGADARPPLIAGYGLEPSDLEPDWFTRPTVPWSENTPVGRVVLDEGRPIGQSFITQRDLDCINAVVVLAPLDQVLPPHAYTGVIYSALDRRHILASTTGGATDPEAGRQQVVFRFEPAFRLKHHRASTPYLFEMTWQRPADYAGPAPAFDVYGGSALVVSDLYIDGERQPDRDLGFLAQGTQTDVTGYTRVLPLPKPSDPVEWTSYFFAVRDDVYRRAGGLSREPTPAEFAGFAERLNKVLLEL